MRRVLAALRLRSSAASARPPPAAAASFLSAPPWQAPTALRWAPAPAPVRALATARPPAASALAAASAASAAPALPPAPPPAPPPAHAASADDPHALVQSPAATWEALRETACARAARPLPVIFASAVTGGALLSAGNALVVAVVGGSPQLAAAAPGVSRLLAGALFPVGLQSILFCRADLLTSSMAHLALPALLAPGAANGAPPAARIGSVIAVTAAGNLAGSVACAFGFSLLLASSSPALAAYVAAAATAKCALPFGVAFAKGVAANALVNVAVFMAATAKTPGGKVALLWPPILTFMVLGLEHSVANMFLLPLAAFMGDVSWIAVAGNIVPVALGNYVGALGFAGYALLSATPAARAAALAALLPK